MSNDDELAGQIVPLLVAISDFYSEFECDMKKRPMLGGVFGSGGYSMASLVTLKNGLHSVRFFVVHDASKVIIGFGDSRERAISAARQILTMDSTHIRVMLGAVQLKNNADEAAAKAARAERQAMAELEAKAVRKREVPRRRRAIFDASEGKCHYCGIALTLDGKWHIEHKMPRALMGTDDPTNLVASCAPCNFKKRDRTDVEFKHERARAA